MFKEIDEDREKILELKSGKIIKRKKKELVEYWEKNVEPKAYKYKKE